MKKSQNKKTSKYVDEEDVDEENEVVLKNDGRTTPMGAVLCIMLVLGVFTMAGGFEGNVRWENSILSEIVDDGLSSLLSSARGTSGEWTGTYIIEENMGNPGWNAQGGVILNIKQNGNAVIGTYEIENYRSGTISGTMSSSKISFTDGFVRFDGMYTDDHMKLNVESCSLNQYCSDPEKVGSGGSSGGISHSYVGEPGIKGTITLYKGSNNLMGNYNLFSDMPDPYAPIGVYTD